MGTRTLTRIASVPAAHWDALFPPDYPFTRHAFLDALERHGCVGGRTGWEPAHQVLEDPAGPLRAAAPVYRKRHSYGEFVFDFGWAEASQRLGVPYYPKWVCAVPFTPVPGPRLGAADAAARGALAAALAQLDEPSIHALFLQPDDAAALGTAGLLERHDLQFEWRRDGAADFPAFLARLSQDKRKKIQRERRRVAEAGIVFEVRRGDTLSEAQWMQVYALYANTYDERGQAPYLTPGFFLDYGRRADTPVHLILAHAAGAPAAPLAVAITLVGGDTLYGRHWGCAERHHSLHFETCYYQGIELCLRHGLSRFNAGTQGPHKLARGFDPVLTRSAHRLADPQLQRAVADFLAQERRGVARQRQVLMAHSAYRVEDRVAHG